MENFELTDYFRVDEDLRIAQATVEVLSKANEELAEDLKILVEENKMYAKNNQLLRSQIILLRSLAEEK